MKKRVMLVILSLFLLILPIGFAQSHPELIIYKENNPQATEPFIAEAGSKLTLWVKLEIGGELINSCDVLGADPCTSMDWGFLDPYTFEVSQNKCNLVPTSRGIFQCVIDVPETTGETRVFFSYNTYGKLDHGGGGKRKLIIYKCGDGECTCTSSEICPENQETCCTDCGVPPLTKCVNNKLELSCGDGLCQVIHTENQNNCCNDCGSPRFYKCENNELVLDTLQLIILFLVGIAMCIFTFYVIFKLFTKAEKQPKERCSECGTPLTSAEEFCPSCGKKV